jgi:hypothetical protein
MRSRLVISIALAALLVLPGALFAQSAPATAKPASISVTLEYFENNSGVFDIKDEKGASVPDPQLGDELKIGWTVVTGKGDVAELKLNHTSTIIKISGSTNFKLEKLRSETGGQDVFSLAVGKVRTVAGKASGKDQYQIRTTSAVCGVRGSDVVVEFEEGSFAKLTTLEGTGWIQNAAGQAIEVAQGFAADALSSTFEAIQVAADILDSLVKDMSFAKLSVEDTLAANREYQASLTAPASQTVETTTPQTTTTEEPKKTNEEKKPNFLDPIMEKLKEILGMEIGSVTIGDTTWATAILQPTFALGELKASLYLPIIYSGDMFNPEDWYHPQGNDEWSFGTDIVKTAYPTDLDYYLAVAGDVASDLFLKIRYLEWGDNRDPFFFKVGNLNDITIGHGLIMRDFANDADFPSVRRVGLNFGIDFTSAGFEAMVNDISAPEVIGGRFYIRPVKNFKAAIGLTALVDLNPAKDWTGLDGTETAASVGNPMFFNTGLDLDLPFFESDFFSIVAFADAAVMLPFFTTEPTNAAYTGIYDATTSGLAFQAIFPEGTQNLANIKNWGVAAGLFGNLIIKDFTWRVEFRDYTGTFMPQFYSTGYERQRNEYMQNVLTYLNDPTSDAYASQTLGIFGEGGVTLPKLFSVKLSYFWPWTQDSTTGAMTFADDKFVISFDLVEGAIPIEVAKNFSLSASYERSNFIPTIMQEGVGTGLNLFDANTVVNATISYLVSEMLNVSIIFTETAARDPLTGALIYTNPGDLLPKMNSSFSVMTQVHL